MRLLFATNNPGKKREIAALGEQFGIEVLMLSDLGIESDPEETGSTFEENALLKVQDIIKLDSLPDDLWVAGDDSGAKILALNGEPGVKTARWAGEKLPVKEMTEFIIKKAAGLKGDDRRVEFISVVALSKKGLETQYFEGKVHGMILEKPRADLEPIEGFPWRQVFYRPDVDEMLGEQHDKNQDPNNYTHREKAFVKVFEHLGGNSPGTSEANEMYPAK